MTSAAAGEHADGSPVVTRGLTKRFGRQLAVAAIHLDVPHGAIYGFLGPNGSGKTTTIRMILGLIRPTAGDVRLLGRAMPGDATDALSRSSCGRVEYGACGDSPAPPREAGSD